MAAADQKQSGAFNQIRAPCMGFFSILSQKVSMILTVISHSNLWHAPSPAGAPWKMNGLDGSAGPGDDELAVDECMLKDSYDYSCTV